MYTMRTGTSGISGALYEMKLISLLYFRAFRDNTIEDFQLATQIDGMGYFDDIYFTAEVKGFHKPLAVFLQARYRERKKLPTTNWKELFGSYLKIIKHFDRINNVPFLKGTFDDIESVFVIYTNATVDDTVTCDDSAGMPFSAKLNDLIGTGGTVKQTCNQEEHLKLMCERAMKEQMVSLAERIAKHINNDRNFEMLLSNDTMLRFHVILAREVFKVSEIQPEGHRVATFRPNFFNTNEEHLTIFKYTLFKEIIKTRKIKPTDITTLLPEYSADPTDVRKLSKVIGTLITYIHGFFEMRKQYTEYFTPQLKQVTVSQQLAARELLSSVRFKVPATFGNKDLIIRGSDLKIERRINYLASKITSLLAKFESSKIVTIDESLENGFLQLKGGITGAIGNLFVLDDDNPKLMKITVNMRQPTTVAKRLYFKLISQVPNLHEYKFYFKLNQCPKLSIEFNTGYEENLARDFLNRLLFYCDQAGEHEVEEILKAEIEDYQSGQADYFQAKTDAIFSRYFDFIQKWWLQRDIAPYLTRDFDLIRQSMNDSIKDPLMSSINLICKSKIKKYGYTFYDDAVRSLNLQERYMRTIIIAENSLLTVTKLMQHLKNKGHVVLDFEHIVNLPADERSLLCIELTQTNEHRVIILVCDETNSINDITTLEIIAKAIRNKKIIVVTNQMTFKILQKYFPNADKILHDKKLSLIDLTEASQMSIFETATVIFPGVEIGLDQLLRGCSK